MKLRLAVVIYFVSACADAAKYIGCFKDTGDRALRGQISSDVMMTNEMCVRQCQDEGFRYAATQNGNYCFCGEKANYAKHGESDACNKPCQGRTTEVCGGPWANSVYEIDAPLLDMVGCYEDRSDRAMTGWWFDSPMMTARLCIGVCKEKGYKYAGLQAGRHCFCGNEYDKYGEKLDRCTSVCSGNLKHVCGGSWANMVYKTEASGEITEIEVAATPLGCYRDAGTRALEALWVHSNSMTNEMCYEICKINGNKYAATQAGAHCFCGDYKYDRYGMMTNCNSKCPGDTTKTCGGGWANQVAQIGGEPKKAYEYEDKGCYLDKSDRAMKGHMFNGAFMTREICVEQCAEMGFAYAATQAGSYCFCDNVYEKHGEYDKCITPCPADSEVTCGGPWANEVFAIKEPNLLYIGCYVDKAVRAIDGFYFRSAQMTADLCVNTCKAKGYMYAGLQAGQYCFCGNEYSEYGEDPNGCRTRCSGNALHVCGGSWRNMVYKTGASGETKGIPVPPSINVGCFKDTGTRALATLWVHTPYMTNQLCMKICSTIGTIYAATQAGQHCFCGDHFNRFGEVSNCNSLCAGDTEQHCGGGWANQVSQIGGFHLTPKTCAVQRAVFAQHNLPVEPEFTEACKFKSKQCNNKDKCWCVHPATGQILSEGGVAKNEDCSLAQPVGCYKDTGDRALSGPYTSSNAMTVSMCTKRCGEQGYPYAGLQAGKYCFCGDEFDKHGPSDNCGTICPGLASQICGGSWANSVYAVENLKLDKVGCYEDKGDRAMTGFWFDSTRMTNELCVRTCGGLGFQYAGTQAGSHCFCGNEYDKYGEYLKRCTTACSGNNKHACGGSWANLVFKTGTHAVLGEAEEAVGSRPIGCYKDAGVRALSSAWIHSNSMTKDMCNRFCRIMGTKYAATQAGSHCFCGDEYDMYGPMTSCTTKCVGNPEETCGGSWANEVYQIGGKTAKPTPVKELGCWRDTGDRALSGQYSNGPYMTNEICHQTCAEEGFKYAATQAGSYCFCGNEYNKHGEYDKCITPCPGNGAATCGGPWANQVVEILEPKQKMVGCFKDAAVRALTGLWFDSRDMTVDLCVDSCRGLGYKYAGLQAGSHCFCGNSYDRYGAYPNRCTSVCSGNRKQVCGGGWANMVYETSKDGTTSDSRAAKTIELGCFQDTSARDLAELWFHSNQMTNMLCQKICNRRGYKYAATQAGSHCFCGNEHNRYGESWNCNSLCAGDRRAFCGGGWANQMYQVGGHAVLDPIETTTPAPPKCQEQKESFKENGLGIEPVFEDEESCLFKEMQCGEKKCYCVKPKTGFVKDSTFEIPVGEKYDCSKKKPGKCERKRFKSLLSNKPPPHIMTCDKTGKKFASKQCFEDECWCVRKKSGKEIKKTRTTDPKLKC